MRADKKQLRKPRRGAMRASFQPDPPDCIEPAVHQQNTYTMWEVENTSHSWADQDPWQAPFSVQPQGWYLEEEAGYSASSFRQTDHTNKKSNKRWAIIALLSLFVIAMCCLVIFNAYQKQILFQKKLQQMQQNAFAQGVWVDGIHIGGKTREEAAALLAHHSREDQQALNIILQIDQIAFRITEQQIPFVRNTQAVLEEAWSLGRRDMLWGISSGLTPFEIRWRHTQQIKKENVHFATHVSYNPADVRNLATGLASQVSKQAINAVIEQFNFSTRQFSVTQDVPGCHIDASQIEEALFNALNHQQYKAHISLQSTPILPQVTSVDLRNNFAQLASVSTKTTSDKARNNNIALAAQAINHHTLMPGDTFSFNGVTGQRTLEKGYQGAPAIAGGVLIDDVGGGVCQVSSTLFNAAALADMTIVERSAHAWPVSYLEKGLDAAVNWPNLDFKFRNDRNTPVFIIADYNNRKLTIEIYGMRSAPGESIHLETELIATTKPPLEPIYQQNPELPPQSSRELKPARTGYKVDTYRVYLRNGAEYRRDKLFSSHYRMVQQVIEYN